MKEFGGYLEIELNSMREYHENAYRFNSARNAFLWLLFFKRPRRLYIPSFICPVITQLLTQHQICFDFYHVDKNCEVIDSLPDMEQDDLFLYVNYFGVKGNYIQRLSQMYNGQIVLDNAQAFFDLPIEGIETFYSPRKFFGVPDGGYAYSQAPNDLYQRLSTDRSCFRFLHLLMRADIGAQAGYSLFRCNEELIDNLPLLKMSTITRKLLFSIDYEQIRLRRKENFDCIHRQLGGINTFQIQPDLLGPLCYPFAVKNATDSQRIREKLLSYRIYLPLYWPDIQTPLNADEENLKQLLPLPIDQNLGHEDILFITRLIKETI